MHSVQLLINFSVSCLSLLAWLINVLVIVLSIDPKERTVTALTNVTLTCMPIRGTPEEYSWYRVNGSIPPHSSGQNSSRLTIHRIVPADEGEYYCMGTAFDNHCAKSNNVKVRVEGEKTTVSTSQLSTNV